MAFGNFGPVMWLFFSAAAIFSSATSTKRDLVLHEERRSLPCGWKKGDRLDPDIIHPVRIGLLHNQLDKGDELVMSVSDPESPKYGQYWTQEEVHSFFSPSEESVTAVLQWLKESIPASDLASSIKQSENNAWLEFSASIQRIEELLGTEFHAYQHESGHTVASAEAYHLPASIQKHIDLVWPGIHLPPKRDTGTKLLQKRDAPDPSPPTQQVPPMALVLDSTSGKEPCTNHSYLNPECIRYLYGIPPGFAPSIPSYRHGIYASGNDHYNPSDLDVFWSNFAPEVPKDAKSTVEEVLNDGAASTINTSRTWGGELYMNVALTVPLLYPNKISIISSDDPIVQANETLAGGYNSMLDAFDGEK
jgi:tripeptidyl-peptidase-1